MCCAGSVPVRAIGKAVWEPGLSISHFSALLHWSAPTTGAPGIVPPRAYRALISRLLCVQSDLTPNPRLKALALAPCDPDSLTQKWVRGKAAAAAAAPSLRTTARLGDTLHTFASAGCSGQCIDCYHGTGNAGILGVHLRFVHQQTRQPGGALGEGRRCGRRLGVLSTVWTNYNSPARTSIRLLARATQSRQITSTGGGGVGERGESPAPTHNFQDLTAPMLTQ